MQSARSTVRYKVDGVHLVVLTQNPSHFHEPVLLGVQHVGMNTGAKITHECAVVLHVAFYENKLLPSVA